MIVWREKIVPGQFERERIYRSCCPFYQTSASTASRAGDKIESHCRGHMQIRGVKLFAKQLSNPPRLDL
jgi:hypothetical protein